MNVKEKLDVFSKIAIKEAEEKRIEILNEINSKYKMACDEFTTQERRKTDEWINEERYKAEQKKNAQVLQAAAAARRSLVDLRARLIDELFESVISKILNYIKTEQYSLSMISDIKALAIRHSGKITIHLCGRDMVFEDSIRTIPNVTVVEDSDELIGGYKAYIKDSNIIIDNTYRQKLEDAKREFVGFRISH